MCLVPCAECGRWEPGDKDGSDMDVWRQLSNPLMPCRRVEGFEPLISQHKKGEKELKRGVARGEQFQFGGLRGSKTQAYHLAQGATSGSVLKVPSL